MPAKWILIDADDTLWDNNVYFEEAFARFIELLDHPQLASDEIRDVLDEIEVESIRTHGYGALNFGRNMQQCFRRLAHRPASEAELNEVMELAVQILEHPVHVFEGVRETLVYLADRHHLTLFSKGHPEEQRGKVDRSGLRPHFHDCRIVREKQADVYRRHVEENEIDPQRTWMVGNSPKSDINPALEAGLGAVFVPHPRTWRLEHAEIPAEADRLHVLERFSDLRTIF
jgi:putative hydrolase of the HAD superfamily